ncbi:MAG: TonB-dependent receptor plug domain-containing protein [Bacteroidales bacterium]|jgi:outer membrane cobalamin receptor|nr:TonB-dependent receptor plug domain-containing protein [Bacteroidales bacterium]
MISCKKVFISAILSGIPALSFSQQEDTIRYYQLPTVNIIDTAVKQRSIEQSSVTINQQMIEKQVATSVGDIAKSLPGVTVKDYGGIGGLKTISIRGLGTSHTAVIYDGIAVSDYMNGQIDLGKYSINNIKEINMSNGQDFDLLQPAKSLSSSNILMIETSKPKFGSRERIQGNTYCSYGSFNYFNPGFLLAFKIGKQFISQLTLDITNTAGNYPYILYYGNKETDSISKEKRKNSDLFSIKGEFNNFITLSKKTEWKTKIYYFYSNRGLPCATIYYYLNSNQRLWDKNAFIQSILSYKFNEYLTYKNHIKLSLNFTHYLDSQYLNTAGFQSDIYKQNEVYLNNVFAFKRKYIGISLTNDISYNILHATTNINTEPKRLTSLTALVSTLNYNDISLTAHILHSYYYDNTSYIYMESFKSSFHPFLSIGYKYKSFALSIFYKDILRNPTFNELYYNRIGSATLRPEKTKQYNLRTAFSKTLSSKNYLYLNASLDFYCNQVFDKIVAMPSRNLFVWSMLNYGQVIVKGIDVLASIRTNIKGIDIHFQASYSLQYATDNEKTSLYYRQQIPYTPRNSGYVFATLSYKSYSFSYNMTYTGIRYAMNENIAANCLENYTDHSLLFQKTFKNKLTLSFSVSNLMNKQYEVVRNYPMPLRQFRITINYKFN